MVDEETVHTKNVEINKTECPQKQIAESTLRNFSERTFDWSLGQVSLILSAYYYTHTFLSPVTGVFVEHVSPIKALMLSKLIHGGICCTIPFLCPFGTTFVVIARLVMGVCSALTFPATFAVLKRVTNNNELPMAVNLFYTMVGVGCVSAPIIAGWYCSDPKLGGWPMSFYVPGGMEMIYVGFTSLFIKRFLSFEKDYEDAKAMSDKLLSESEIKNDKWKLFFDWKVYVLAYTDLNFTLIFKLITMTVPQYLAEVIHFPIFDNGILSSIPMIIYTFTSLISTFITSYCINKLNYKPQRVHSLFYTVFNISGFMLPLISPFIGCNGYLAVVIFTLWMMCSTVCFSHVICVMSQYDKHIGIVGGIVTSIGNSAGFLTPLVIHFFVADDVTDSSNWIHAFITLGVLDLLGSVFFNMVLWIKQTNSYLLGKNSVNVE